MEPMTLGSPVGSPVSPGLTSVTSPFLPSFLMGDLSSSGPRPQQATPMGSRSPSRLVRHVSFTSPTQPPPQERSVLGTPVPEKASGPATRGLFDTLDTYSPKSFTPQAHAAQQNTPQQYAPQQYASQQYASQQYAPQQYAPGQCIPQSPASHSTHGSPNLSHFPEASLPPGAHNWVTVFGFPPSSASAVLSQFSRYGTMVEVRPSQRGNWAHVRYGSPAEARRALAKNAKLFGGNVMVGVVPCTDPDVIGTERERGKENVALPGRSDASFVMSPGAYPGTPGAYPGSPAGFGNVSRVATPLGLSSPANATPSRARPIGQAYANARHSSEVAMARHTPQKSTGLVTKAWELLGW